MMAENICAAQNGDDRTAHTTQGRKERTSTKVSRAVYELCSIAHHRKPENHRAPEKHIVQEGAALHPLGSLHQHNRHLQHHGDKAVAAELPRDATHDQLVSERADEEGDCRRKRARHVATRCRIDVASEEVVHWLIPFPGEL